MISIRFYFSVYSFVFVSIEKIYQTLETVFRPISKHLEFRQKYSAALNSLLGVWISSMLHVCTVQLSVHLRVLGAVLTAPLPQQRLVKQLKCP